ncbi:MAG: hypothetical protein AVDCRST_MAG12-1329, partial [uncultured Rubrobacteraceae bacterium]
AGGAFAARSRSGEARARRAGRDGDGPLPDERPRPRGRRRGDRRAHPARRRGARRDARGLHRLAGRPSRRPRYPRRGDEAGLSRGAPGLRPTGRARQPRPRPGGRGPEDLAGCVPQRSPGGGRGGRGRPCRCAHRRPPLRRRLRRRHALRQAGRARRLPRRDGTPARERRRL